MESQFHTNRSAGSDETEGKVDEPGDTADESVNKKQSEEEKTIICSSGDEENDEEGRDWAESLQNKDVQTTICFSDGEEVDEEGKDEAGSFQNKDVQTTICSSDDEEGDEEERDGTGSLQNRFTQTDLMERLHEFVSPEESNFLRFCHLIQKVAPQALRYRFDQEFPPADLEGIIQQNMALLQDLHKQRVITHPQWKLICPSGSTPLSSTFDVTTMVCLFRHLTKIAPQSGLHDTLPPQSDTCLGADLARIKYFRNRIAHYLEKDRKLDNREFPIVWDTASKAVSRIGGKLYEQECSSLRTANLDSSYRDIFRDSLMMEMELKQEITDLKEGKRKLETQVKKLEIQQKDPLPPHERKYVHSLITHWESRKDKFVETSAAKYLTKIMETENVAIVTGCPGAGKSFTVQNVLLSMRAKGYDVIQVRTSSDLVRYFSGSARQVFYLDNMCGKHNISNSDIEEWGRNRERLVDIFTNSLTKCILICRLQIFLDSNFRNLNLENYKVINLSGDHQLTMKEKQSVGQIHIGKVIMKQLSVKIIVNCVCFPLLCSLYDKNTKNTAKFFEKPKTYFENELTELRNNPHKVKYACIALCVMLNNNVEFGVFTGTNIENRKMITNVFEELEINTPPMKAIQSSFDSMVGSFFKKTYRGYKSIHDYMFDIYCIHISKTMISTIIMYADSQLISERVLLQSLGEVDEYAIIIDKELENDYFKRILKDLSLDRVSDVFRSSQMKYKSYRTKFLSLLRWKDVRAINENSDTLIYIASEAGHVEIVEWLCDKGADVNQCPQYRQSPLTAASEGGHINVVELLCKKGADVNRYGEYGSTPLIAGSEGGHINIVELLCNKGADVNQCDGYGSTPLIAASKGGHINIVELLCNKRADVNQCDGHGSIALIAASERGHISIVELLCNKGADVNQYEYGLTPMTAAAGGGHINVVELLCNKGADVNQCDGYESTPLTAASKEGHMNIVELLCNKGADVNRYGEDGSTPLTAATKGWHINVVELLCNKGADVNQWDRYGSTPLIAASKGVFSRLVEGYGLLEMICPSKECHINVVELLCNKGADVNQYGRYGLTPLTVASKGGHKNIVELLCNKGADVNQYGEDGLTPLSAALGRGHIDVVELLLR